MTSHSYKSSRTGAFRTRSERRRTGKDDTDEVCSDSSVTSSISSRCLAELRTLCKMLKRFSRCLAELRTLCEMLKRFSRWQLMLSVAAHAASTSHWTSHERGPLRPTTPACSDHLRRLGSFTRTVSSILTLDVTRARSTEAYYSCVLRPSSSSWILHTHRVVHPHTGRHTSEVC